jgi:hypothetical protein
MSRALASSGGSIIDDMSALTDDIRCSLNRLENSLGRTVMMIIIMRSMALESFPLITQILQGLERSSKGDAGKEESLKHCESIVSICLLYRARLVIRYVDKPGDDEMTGILSGKRSRPVLISRTA